MVLGIPGLARAVSSVGERVPDTDEVTGSNPVRPTHFEYPHGTRSEAGPRHDPDPR
jgi:hypothetical protein